MKQARTLTDRALSWAFLYVHAIGYYNGDRASAADLATAIMRNNPRVDAEHFESVIAENGFNLVNDDGLWAALSQDESLYVPGSTPREAVFRAYIVLKNGAVIDIPPEFSI